MSTITIGRLVYQVERLPDAEVHGMNRPGYMLTGPRGARYRTMRSMRQPHRMYLINARIWTMNAPRCWLTDKNGNLEVA